MSVCFTTLHISYSTTLPRYSLIHCISAHINISIHIYISTLGPYNNWFITSHRQKSTFLASTTNILFIPPDSSHYNTSSSPLAPFSLNKRNHVPVLLNKNLVHQSHSWHSFTSIADNYPVACCHTQFDIRSPQTTAA